MSDGERVLDILAGHPATARSHRLEARARFVSDDAARRRWSIARRRVSRAPAATCARSSASIVTSPSSSRRRRAAPRSRRRSSSSSARCAQRTRTFAAASRSIRALQSWACRCTCASRRPATTTPPRRGCHPGRWSEPHELRGRADATAGLRRRSQSSGTRQCGGQAFRMRCSSGRQSSRSSSDRGDVHADADESSSKIERAWRCCRWGSRRHFWRGRPAAAPARRQAPDRDLSARRGRRLEHDRALRRAASTTVCVRSIAIPRPGDRATTPPLDLDGFFGLHPRMAPLKPLWDNRSLAIVHACGSPDSTRSHFDAQDYMETATPGDQEHEGRVAEPVPAGAPMPTTRRSGPSRWRGRCRASLQGAAPALAMASIGEFGVRGGTGDAGDI